MERTTHISYLSINVRFILQDGYFNYFDLSALGVLRYDTLNSGAARGVVSFATVAEAAEVEAAVRNHCSADCGGNADVSR